MSKKPIIVIFFKNCDFFTLFSLLSCCCPGIFRAGTGCQNASLARPVEKCQNPIRARSLSRIWVCPIVPLSRDNEWTSVPLSLCPGTMKKLLSLCPAGQENSVPLETLVQKCQVLLYGFARTATGMDGTLPHLWKSETSTDIKKSF